MFAPAGERDTGWMRALSDDLQRPVFLMGYGLAFSRRLSRNYVWMFLIVLIAWLLKISTPKLMPDGTPGHFAHSFAEWATGATIGPVPGWAVVLVVAAFYCWIIYTAFRRYAGEGELFHRRCARLSVELRPTTAFASVSPSTAGRLRRLIRIIAE